jgi:membrane AbrB-like protein
MSLEVLLTLALGFAASWGATRLKMPSGSILGPMIVVGGLQLSEALPLAPLGAELRFIALCTIGAVVGTAFNRGAIALMVRSIRLAAIGVFLLVFSGLLGGWLLEQATGMQLITAFLGLSPGGASEMAAAALDFHADAGVVAALHMVRQISVFMMIPLVFRLTGLRSDKQRET